MRYNNSVQRNKLKKVYTKADKYYDKVTGMFVFGRERYMWKCVLCAFVLIIFMVSPCLADRIELGNVVQDGVTYDYCVVNPAVHDIQLFWPNAEAAKGTIQVLRDSLAERGLSVLFATNAGIFFSQAGKYTPLGLHIEEGHEAVSINTGDGEGNFYLKPNGVFSIVGDRAAIVKTEHWLPNPRVRFACQSGPILLFDRQLHPRFKKDSRSKYIRNGVGVRDNGEIVFAISTEPVTLWAFATMFRDALKCPDALYLDGAISEMYAPELGRTNVRGQFAGIWAVVERVLPSSQKATDFSP